MADENKRKKVELAIAQIHKNYGRESIMRFGDNPLSKVDVISTQCLPLDIALRLGGLPRGRLVEIFGPEGSGKTTVCLHVVAEAQKQGGIAAFVDMEHALDAKYARNLGVNVDDLLVSQPDYAEQALNIIVGLVASGGVDCIVLDSVASLVPKAEFEADMEKDTVGLQARIMSRAMRKLAGMVHKSDTLLIFTNQLREKVGMMFGNPEVTPGGRALKFYSSVRMDIRRKDTIKDEGEVSGILSRVRVIKNKVAPPFGEAEVLIEFGKGISSEASTLDVAEKFGVVSKSGSWWYPNINDQENTKVQGYSATIEWLRQHPKEFAALDEATRQVALSTKEG